MDGSMAKRSPMLSMANIKMVMVVLAVSWSDSDMLNGFHDKETIAVMAMRKNNKV